MRLRGASTPVLSPSDLAHFSTCEWGFVRSAEGKLGIAEAPPREDDPMLTATSKRGLAHEARVLEILRQRHGDVAEIPDPQTMAGNQWDNLSAAASQTLEALTARRRVVFQAAFYSGSFSGFADFLVWNTAGYYEVVDSKLARSAKVSALLQLAAYAGHLRELDIPVGPQVSLWLGSDEVSTHDLADIEPVYRHRMARLRAVVDDLLRIRDTRGEGARWADEKYDFCGECAACKVAIEQTDDLLKIAGIRRTQRAKIKNSGLHTLKAFADSHRDIPGLDPRVRTNLRLQAQAQRVTEAHPEELPFVDFDRPDALRALPDPSPGDIFFDFEGDPLYQEGTENGLDYLFGWVDAERRFAWRWADSLSEEKTALEEFVDEVIQRREREPGMHVYHYASYEQTHLLQLAQRHGTREAEVDQLVRDHVLVNLLPIVTNSLRLGLPSYSIKYLELVYLSTPREGDVTTAVDSVVDYHRYQDATASGDSAEAGRIQQSVLDYNETDCVSTLELRDWLLQRRQKPHIPPKPRDQKEPGGDPPDAVRDELLALVDGVSFWSGTRNEQAILLAAEAVGYHRRESRTFWWSHFRRLTDPIQDWNDERGVVISRTVTVRRDWEHKRTWSYRELLIEGDFAPGTTLKAGNFPFALYDQPAPRPAVDPANPLARGVAPKAEVIEAGDGYVVVKEGVKTTDGVWRELPIALAPSAPPADTNIRQSIQRWAIRIVESLPERMPEDPALDILRREPPRGVLSYPSADVPEAEAIFESVRGLENSYLAVQGPPGTGKTFNGAEVIRRLVGIGWRVGVVAQSHAAVENLLRKCAEVGIRQDQIGKKLQTGQLGSPDDPWTPLKDSTGVAEFLQKPGGRVLGGTVWTFCNENAVEQKALRLMVVEEAGQYSLANTIAVSQAADSLLLLGDPQQLAEVSQGSHPAPVDTSALGWLSENHDVLPAERGIFLERSFRMHPALCDVVSRLSYDGRLSAVANESRHFDGCEPGMHLRPVPHHGNSVESVEEADEIVRIVDELSAHTWRDGETSGPLREWDRGVIVVAPYNAQVNLIRQSLDSAGFHDVPVGTVDKFQGQEAAIAILSMSASSLHDVPRGIDFLLNRNRLNVALSRAQWASFLVFSPALIDFLPKTPGGVALLSRFADLVQSAQNSTGQAEKGGLKE